MDQPTFIIAGERRSGTTSLSKWLRTHPSIWMPPTKDLFFFVEEEMKGRKDWRKVVVKPEHWAMTHTPEDYTAAFQGAGPGQVAGEKSADYLFWTPCHARIHEFRPDIRLILTLRNPVERAWSHYWNEVGKGRENLPFTEAIEKEASRSHRSPYARFHLSYTERGFYSRSLTSLFSHIPREQVHVLILEETQRDPATALRGVYKFLGMDPEPGLKEAARRHNPGWTLVRRGWTKGGPGKPVGDAWLWMTEKVIKRMTRDEAKRRRLRTKLGWPVCRSAARQSMPADVRTTLDDLYAGEIVELESLLDRDLGIWKR